MRWQTTAALAVILALLGAFYYVYEIRLGPGREQAQARKGRVWAAEPADVQEVTIRRPDGTVRVKRDGDRWRLLEPVTSRADGATMNDALTTIVTARIDREIASQPGSLAEFGLDRPAAEVTLTLKDGQALGLQLGARNPTGTWVYARERDKPAVFLLPEGVLRDATRPVADFRDKTILAFDRQEVTGLDIVLPDDTLALAFDEQGWRLTRPRALPADAQRVNDLVDKLRTARVKEFVAESPRSLQAYGLERPVRLHLHTGKDKERATKTLLLGRVEAGRGVYAMREGEGSVLLLPEDLWTSVPRNVAAVRDKTVVALERDRVTQLDIETGRGSVTLVREGNAWRITRPEALPADQVEVGILLGSLQGLQAQAFLSEDASGVRRWLARPEVRVTITEKDGAAPRTVLLAPSPDRRAGQPMAYAAVAERGPVVLVDAKALTDLGKSLHDLRDRTLVAGLEPRDVKRLQVSRDGQRVLLERRGEDSWRVLEPAPGAARASRVDDVLYGLRGLKWQAIVSPQGEDLARWGLDTPAAEVGLYREDGTAIVRLLVGKRDGDRLYVKTAAAPTVYAVQARELELPKVPDDFVS